jgi:hydrogenase expression/formation protein HypE
VPPVPSPQPPAPVGDVITLAHGGGGRLARRLIREVLLVELGPGPELAKLGDAAVLEGFDGTPVVTTDGSVVSPRIFPGGDIGRLAVSGTVNDLLAAGARPRVLTLGLIIEDGFSVGELRNHLKSIRAAAAEAGVRVVCGDTKVVERGAADGLFITAAGVGELVVRPAPGPWRLAGRTAGAVILSGTLGDHGVTLLGCRHGLRFEAPLASDCAPLTALMLPVLEALGQRLLCLRDPTRGGLAAVLGEIAEEAGIGVEIVQQQVPAKPAVHGVCDLLGVDLFSLANEGKMVLFVEPNAADEALRVLRGHPLGREAALIGRIVPRQGRPVQLVTPLGVRRPLEAPFGELLPRIC